MNNYQLWNLENGRWAVTKRGYVKFCGSLEQCQNWLMAAERMRYENRAEQDYKLRRAIYG